MGYEEALKAAGAEIIEFESFGSYQGNWVAKVNYEGVVGWVIGSYGSCSGCDAFEAEFDYVSRFCSEHWMMEVDCDSCRAEQENFDRRLADFGRSYLNDIYTQEEAERYCGQHANWSIEDKEMFDFVVRNK